MTQIKKRKREKKKFINLYVEPDLFTDNVNSFNKNSIPKHPDLSYAGHKTFIFIRIHLHNQVVNQPKKHNTASTSEFGEYNLIFEYVFSNFTFFIYILGKKNFSMKEIEGKYMLYNTNNFNETICFDYRSSESQFTESKANITFVINHKKVNNYDRENFISLINIAEGNVGVYVKKEYKDFHFQLTPSKSLNLPLINLGNQEYRPKLNILMEDKICVKSTDPFPKEIEKKLNNETIFVRIYKDFDEKTFKNEKLPGIKVFTYKQKLSGIDQTIVILANVDYIYEKVEKIGYKVIRNSYFKDREMSLYFIDESASKDLFGAYKIDIFLFQCQLQAMRKTMQDAFKSTYKQILKNEFDIYIFNKSENYISITFL